jgi:GntR family transcriptional regulator
MTQVPAAPRDAPFTWIDAEQIRGEVHRSSGLTLHAELERALRWLIQSGQVSPGARMPGEFELAAALGVSRHTLRHALGVLTAEGLLRRERGRRGTTVVSVTHIGVFQRGLNHFYAFAWEARARGATQRSRVLERATMRPTSGVAQRLLLAASEKVERIVRLRIAADEPLVLETTRIPQALAAYLTAEVLERDSIYDVLEDKHSLRIVGAHESIHPVTLERSAAMLLGVRPGAAAFLVQRTTISDRGPIEYQESILRGDRYLYSVDLPRTSVRP